MTRLFRLALLAAARVCLAGAALFGALYLLV
jgi:hypothetical protein